MVGRIALAFRWRTAWVALAMLAAGAALLWTLHPPVYQTNDDVSIRLALEGQTAPGESATGFTALTHAGMGWPVAVLYRLFPGVPWWDLVTASVLLAAIAVMVALAWEALTDDWLARAMSLGVLLTVVLPLLVSFQYTVGATLGGSAATLLAVVEASRTRPRRSVLLAAGLLLVTALLVRTLGAAAGIVATSLLCVPLVTGRVVTVRPTMMVIVAAATLCAAVQYLDGALYLFDDDWAKFGRYQWMLVRLFEWRGELPQDQADTIRAAVGWTRNDWNMIQGYFGVDPSIHGYDRVALAFETSARNFGWGEWARLAGARVGGLDLSAVRVMAERSMIPLVSMAIAAVAYASRRGTMLVALVGALFIVLCVGIETAFKELPLRLLGPLQVGAVFAGVVAISTCRRRPSPVRAVLAVGFVLSLLAYQAAETEATAASLAADARALDQEMPDVLALSPTLLVLHADTFPREVWWRPFHRTPSEPPTIALAWNNQNPSLQAFLRKSGREGLLRAMCGDPSILVVAEEGRLDVVAKFFEEHLGSRIRWARVYDGSFPVWRCSLSGPTS